MFERNCFSQSGRLAEESGVYLNSFRHHQFLVLLFLFCFYTFLLFYFLYYVQKYFLYLIQILAACLLDYGHQNANLLIFNFLFIWFGLLLIFYLISLLNQLLLLFYFTLICKTIVTPTKICIFFLLKLFLIFSIVFILFGIIFICFRLIFI